MAPYGHSVLIEVMPFQTEMIGFTTVATQPIGVDRVKLCGSKQFGMGDCHHPSNATHAPNTCQERNMYCFKMAPGKWLRGAQTECRGCSCINEMVHEAMQLLYYGKMAVDRGPPKDFDPDNRQLGGVTSGSLDPKRGL